MMKLSELKDKLDSYFPRSNAEDWDNVGLQVGDLSSGISKVLLALNPREQVVQRAKETGADLIITHHPLLFAELDKLNLQSTVGSVLKSLVRENINLFSIHTNLDVASKGTSWQLANRLGWGDLRILQVTSSLPVYKLVVFVPEDKAEQFREDILASGFGNIGNYSHCSFSSEGEGTFFPKEGSSPFIGQDGELSKVNEVKFETVFPPRKLKSIEDIVNRFHPYEEPAYEIYRLENSQKYGLGVYADLEDQVMVSDLVEEVKDAFDPPYTILNSDEDKQITRAGVIGGSGDSVVQSAIEREVDILIGGEFDYHKKLMAANQGLITLEISHFSSEFPVMFYLRDILDEKLNLDVSIFKENQHELQG